MTHLDNILRVASEVFFEPLFAEDSVERERGAISDEIRQRQDQLWYKNRQFYTSVRFKGKHPLKLDGGGSLEAITHLKREDLIKYWANFFFPKNTYLVLVGGFNTNKIRSQIAKYYGGNTKGDIFAGFPKLTNQHLSEKSVSLRSDSELSACYIDLTFPGVFDSCPISERVTQGIIRSILGGLHSSRLYRLLRERRGLVYDVGCSSESYQNFGTVGIYFQVAPENLGEVLQLVIKELSAFVTIGPAQAEIDFAKNYSINQALMSFDHPGTIANWIEGDLLWEDRIYTPEEYVKIIERVDIEGVKEVMKKYWDFKKLNLVIQGPIENSKENRDRFEKILLDLN